MITLNIILMVAVAVAVVAPLVWAIRSSMPKAAVKRRSPEAQRAHAARAPRPITAA
jgi:hypothetical protein